ncbi:MAG TPA: hypothetical protein VKH19_19655 [Gemmatimonadaceae bacterium]|nr:hypothetical protein [Gemmatimonadaceae bacterium]
MTMNPMREDAFSWIGQEPTLELSAPAWREWNRNVESVLRGIAHALNNRAAALSAVIELAGDDDDRGSTSSILKTELHKVRDLSAVIRTLGKPRQGKEAFAPREAAADAMLVLGVHADQRERATLIEASNGAAVRVERWMYVRALVTLVASVPIGGATTHSVKVEVVEDGDWVVTRAGAATGRLADRSDYTCELARAMGGEALDDGYGFRLPSLAMLRRLD